MKSLKTLYLIIIASFYMFSIYINSSENNEALLEDSNINKLIDDLNKNINNEKQSILNKHKKDKSTLLNQIKNLKKQIIEANNDKELLIKKHKTDSAHLINQKDQEYRNILNEIEKQIKKVEAHYDKEIKDLLEQISNLENLIINSNNENYELLTKLISTGKIIEDYENDIKKSSIELENQKQVFLNEIDKINKEKEITKKTHEEDEKEKILEDNAKEIENLKQLLNYERNRNNKLHNQFNKISVDFDNLKKDHEILSNKYEINKTKTKKLKLLLNEIETRSFNFINFITGADLVKINNLNMNSISDLDLAEDTLHGLRLDLEKLKEDRFFYNSEKKEIERLIRYIDKTFHESNKEIFNFKTKILGQLINNLESVAKEGWTRPLQYKYQKALRDFHEVYD